MNSQNEYPIGITTHTRVIVINIMSPAVSPKSGERKPLTAIRTPPAIKVSAQAVSPVPVLCAVQRPGEFDAHSIVLLEFGHVIPEYDEQDSHQYGDDEVDIHIRAQGSCIGKAAVTRETMGMIQNIRVRGFLWIFFLLGSLSVTQTEKRWVTASIQEARIRRKPCLTSRSPDRPLPSE